jgi:hypothetical protein
LQTVASKPPANERFPYAAFVVTAVFAIEILTRSSAEVSSAASIVFWGEAGMLAPLMQSVGMGNAPTGAIFTALIAILFIVLAFLETAFLILARRATPRVRWLVRATVAAVAVGLLLFTPAAGPMRLF